MEALVKAMEYFILNPAEIENMGRQSRIIAETVFDVHAVNKQIIDHMLVVIETNFEE